MKAKIRSTLPALLALCVALPCIPGILKGQALPDLPFDSGSTGADGALRLPLSTTPRSYPGMAYDPAHQQTVLFGGYSGGTLGGTWIWEGGDWNQLAPTSSPAPRHGHGMIYDEARGEIVLFGGVINGNVALSDTWTWNGTNWNSRNAGTARYYFSMAYDQVRRQVVVFGGADGGSVRNDTRLWNGTNWSLVTPARSPTERYRHAMAYDAARQQVVLFGGDRLNQGLGALNDTWTWNGSNWTQMQPVLSPPRRTGHSLAYDAERQEIVLFGGSSDDRSSDVIFNDTWVWNGTNWFLRQPSLSPGRRVNSAMAYDSQLRRIVLANGSGDGHYQDTWLWDGTNWTPHSGWFDMRARPNGTWNFTTIDVPANQSVRFLKNAANTPVRWLASSNVTIAGSIFLDGDFGAPIPYDLPAPGGPGGFNGGLGGGPFNQGGSYAGAPGDGPGGGAPGTNQSLSGASAKYASAPYGNSFLQPLIGGSGGGGGGSSATARGGRGGGGGGAILLSSSRDIVINGGIMARGGTGETSESGGGTGGAGSGGAVRLQADRITINGTLNVRNDGRLRLESYVRTIAVVTNIYGSNVIGFPVATQPFDTPAALLRITSVAGQNVAQPPTGDPFSPDVIFTAAGDITVTVQADSSIPNGTPVKLRVTTLGVVINKPSANDPPVLLNNGTANFTLTVPRGFGTIQASAEFTLAGP